MKLKVKKGLRLVPGSKDLENDKLPGMLGGLSGAVYIQGDIVEPDFREARVLLEAFPDHFEKVE